MSFAVYLSVPSLRASVNFLWAMAAASSFGAALAGFFGERADAVRARDEPRAATARRARLERKRMSVGSHGAQRTGESPSRSSEAALCLRHARERVVW